MKIDTDITRRLHELRDEFAKGENMLNQMEQEATQLRERLLRLSGAIQVLEELEHSPESDSSSRSDS